MSKSLKILLYIIGLIIVVPVSVGFVYFAVTLAGGAVFIGIGFVTVMVGFTLLMRSGVKQLNRERDNVFAQLRFNMPIRYNTGRIILGFCQLLGFFWLIVPFVMIATGKMWMAALPVVTVAVWVIESLAARFWTDIGWKKSKYWLMNIIIYILGIVVGIFASGLIYG